MDDKFLTKDEDCDALPTVQDEPEEAVNCDWKAARAVLKELRESMDDSIDWYFKKQEVNALRERFNAKERTQELFDTIMAYKEG